VLQGHLVLFGLLLCLLMGVAVKLIIDAVASMMIGFMTLICLMALLMLAPVLLLSLAPLLVICAPLYLMSQALSEGCSLLSEALTEGVSGAVTAGISGLASGCATCLEATAGFVNAVGTLTACYQLPSVRQMAAAVAQVLSEAISEAISDLSWDISVCDGSTVLHHQLSMPPHFSARFFSSQPPPTRVQLGLVVCVRV
jgi:hypothetical protein